MAKHTYGFPTGTDPDAAIASALTQAREDGFNGEQTQYNTEIVETDEHRANGEMCVVIRTSS